MRTSSIIRPTTYSSTSNMQPLVVGAQQQPAQQQHACKPWMMLHDVASAMYDRPPDCKHSETEQCSVISGGTYLG